MRISIAREQGFAEHRLLGWGDVHMIYRFVFLVGILTKSAIGNVQSVKMVSSTPLSTNIIFRMALLSRPVVFRTACLHLIVLRLFNLLNYVIISFNKYLHRCPIYVISK